MANGPKYKPSSTMDTHPKKKKKIEKIEYVPTRKEMKSRKREWLMSTYDHMNPNVSRDERRNALRKIYRKNKALPFFGSDKLYEKK